ncbi:MAG: hypothetical protein NVS9B4_06740 [Candidatus Acidiferrum sp.]
MTRVSLSDDREGEIPEERTWGLCARCVHARQVESSRGSIFVLCQLSREDARFLKYPVLPVGSCSGFGAKAEQV